MLLGTLKDGAVLSDVMVRNFDEGFLAGILKFHRPRGLVVVERSHQTGDNADLHAGVLVTAFRQFFQFGFAFLKGFEVGERTYGNPLTR